MIIPFRQLAVLTAKSIVMHFVTVLRQRNQIYQFNLLFAIDLLPECGWLTSI